MPPNKMERFTRQARRVLSLAQKEAERLQHNTIGTEHLLLGLMREGDDVAWQVLHRLGLKQRRVEELVVELTHVAPRSPSTMLALSPGTKQVLELAVDEARRTGYHYIGTEHLLLGLLRHSDGVAIEVLKRLGVSPEEVRRHTPSYVRENALDVAARITYESAEPIVGNIRHLRLVITDKISGEVKADVKLPTAKIGDGVIFVFEMLRKVRENRGGRYSLEADDFTIQVDLLYADEGKEEQ